MKVQGIVFLFSFRLSSKSRCAAFIVPLRASSSHMDRNQIIGILLIIAVLFLWNLFFIQPEMEEQRRKIHLQDSLKNLQSSSEIDSVVYSVVDSSNLVPSDSVPVATVSQRVEEKEYVLENERIRIRLSNKGGVIREAVIKDYRKSYGQNDEQPDMVPVRLMEDPKNVFEYRFQSQGKEYRTGNMMFEAEQSGDLLVRFTVTLDNGTKFSQQYSLLPGEYTLQHTITAIGIEHSRPVQLHWENYLDKIEKNWEYERYNSTVYFKEKEQDPDYCSCRGDDKIESQEKRVQWISHSNQFFNSSLMAANGFSKGSYETILLNETDGNLKKLVSSLEIDGQELAGKPFEMKWYIGPNEYNRLKTFEVDLQYIIPYGWSIFGTVNRYIIRPLFNVLEDLVGAKGVIILLMTLIVKLLVFPLGYKMLHSQAKMTALKPEIDKLKSKFKDDLQKQQMETMKMYNEFGVNPLGGCFPLLLQMPIWIALYRFFPATIDFRQESFLWAPDLTAYDEFLKLPFSLPLFGESLSLFAFLWMVSTLVFSYYSSKTMDFSANPAMKYMQYLMPVIFWFMFNKTASGLTCYMFFSNILNIAQTLLGKYYLFDQEKIRAELELNKAKPKKQGGFRDRLEQMMKEQQRVAQEKAKQNKK